MIVLCNSNSINRGSIVINTQIKKVAAIHDLSGYGRCSLSVIIPIVTAMGIQVCPVPTAVLSTHTGGFSDIVFKDLTDYIRLCRDHYNSIGVKFDAVYSGFLASAEQIDGCLQFFHETPDSLKIVDPVMGDNGTPYKTYTKQLCDRMNELVDIADIITPNLTEAAILLGEEYSPELNAETAANWLERLCKRVPAAIITGVVIGDRVFNIGADKSGNIYRAEYEYIREEYPGTGDIFASVLTGALVSGDSLHTAIVRATEFTGLAVKITHQAGGENRCGVMFEGILHKLLPQTL